MQSRMNGQLAAGLFSRKSVTWITGAFVWLSVAGWSYAMYGLKLRPGLGWQIGQCSRSRSLVSIRYRAVLVFSANVARVQGSLACNTRDGFPCFQNRPFRM